VVLLSVRSVIVTGEVTTVRAFGWAALAPAMRMRVVRVLADAEGLDGYGAVAAVTSALRSDRSLWAPAVDKAIGLALAGAFAEAVEPIVIAARAIFETMTCSEFWRVLASMGPPVVTDDVEGCRCLCLTHAKEGRGLCLGLDAPELVPFVFPGPPDTAMRRTVRMCGPCAAAQEVRFGQRRRLPV
jgi:hypothetical protein